MNEQEQRWIQAARGGDEAAFGELVRLRFQWILPDQKQKSQVLH